MLRPLYLWTVVGLSVAGPVRAQTFAGTYAATNGQGSQTVVTLRQDGPRVTGTIVGNGNTFQLSGTLEEGTLVGTVAGAPGAGLWFEAELDGADLYLTLVGAGADGKPDYDQATTLVFARHGADGAAAVEAANPLAGAAASTGPEDPWVGTFTNGTLVLRLQGSAGRYAGVARLGGQEFPVTAAGTPAHLSGSFRSADGEYGLTLERQGDEVMLETGGTRYTLQREAGVANPLTAAEAAPSAGRGAAGAGQALDDGTALGREWVQFLAGKKATKMSSYSSGSAGGYSSRTDVHLCASGQFAMAGSDLVTVDVGDAGGYSGGNTAGRGTWRIITQGAVAGIELRYANGQTEQHRLDYQDNKTYVDGERWLITPSEACGGG